MHCLRRHICAVLTKPNENSTKQAFETTKTHGQLNGGELLTLKFA